MFDFVTRHKRLIQVVLAIIFLPFAFFGVDVYFRGADTGRTVARVGDYAISQEEFSRSLRERQQALQTMMQGRLDPAMLDTPELRQSTLETLIQKRLLLDRALRSGMTVSDGQLKALIVEQQSFRDESGKFSFPRYEQFLKSEGMTPATFETRLRHDMLLQQFFDGFADSSFVPRAVTERLARLSAQKREISHAVIAPERYLSQVKLDPGAAKKHYEASPDEFRVPEQARVEYVVLSIESLMQRVQIEPAEARKYYDANLSQFGAAEARQAAHILVAVDPAAGAETKQKARAQAQALVDQIRKKPDSFADLARKHSQDPGSAAKGGDLGYIGRGAMKDAPEFESALYKLKPGEVSLPVETRHGFHIIRLIALQPAQTKPFEAVRGQIEQDLKKQQAARRYAELADNFNNVVYEQSESLKAAADLLKAAPQQSGWFSRAQAGAPLNNARLLAAIFSDEALKNRRNTEAVEVASGTLIAARVLEHKPASLQPFDEVRAGLEKKLALREAARLTAEEGRRLLDELKQGKRASVSWSAPQLVTREGGKDIPEPVIRHAFRMDISKLPGYAGLDSPQGAYILLRLSRVEEAENPPAEKARELAEQLRTVLGQEALAAYVATLRQQVGVNISKDALEKKQ